MPSFSWPTDKRLAGIRRSRLSFPPISRARLSSRRATHSGLRCARSRKRGSPSRLRKDGCVSTERVQPEPEVSLAPMTTLGIGGPARWFLPARTAHVAVQALHWARAHDQKVLVLG